MQYRSSSTIFWTPAWPSMHLRRLRWRVRGRAASIPQEGFAQASVGALRTGALTLA